jgi:hypothetical protein
VIIFNPIFLAILKWLRFKLLRWMHYLHHLALLSNGLGLFSIFWYPWILNIPSLVDFAIEIKACTFEVVAVPAYIHPCSTVC